MSVFRTRKVTGGKHRKFKTSLGVYCCLALSIWTNFGTIQSLKGSIINSGEEDKGLISYADRNEAVVIFDSEKTETHHEAKKKKQEQKQRDRATPLQRMQCGRIPCKHRH